MPPLNRWSESVPLDGASTHSSLASAVSNDVQQTFKFSPQRCRKSVTFHPTISRVEYIDHHSEWLAEERSARWHSQDEYASFRRDIISTTYLLRNHPEKVDDNEYTARGIECRDPVAVDRRQYIKQCAWNAVFEEQQVQRQNRDGMPSCSFDGEGEWIATLYSQTTKAALREALDFAALDQIAALNHQMEGKINVTDDDFNDDWISSISSLSPSHSSLSANSEMSSILHSKDDFGFSVFGAASGFDDSWITQDI